MSGGNNGGRGGFASMTWRTCHCGRRFVVSYSMWLEHQCPICRKGGDGTPKSLKKSKPRDP